MPTTYAGFVLKHKVEFEKIFLKRFNLTNYFMEITNVQTEKKIVELLKASPARYFELEKESVEHYVASTRCHGDVGLEQAGKEDILAAKESVAFLNKKLPGAYITYEVCDEWVHIDIQLPRKFVVPEHQRNQALELCQNILTQEASILKIDLKNIDNIKTSEPKTGCYKISQVANFYPIFVPKSGNQEDKSSEDFNPNFDLESNTNPYAYANANANAKIDLEAWMPLSIKTTLFEKDHKEFIQLQIQGLGKQRDYTQEITHDSGLETVCSSLTKTFLQTYKESIRTDLWTEIPLEEVNEILHSGEFTPTLVGYSGYEELWENCPIYKCIPHSKQERTPTRVGTTVEATGNATEEKSRDGFPKFSKDTIYLHIDSHNNHSNQEQPTYWKISQKYFQEATQHLMPGFFPKTPQGSLPLNIVVAQMTKKIRKDIFNKASQLTENLAKKGSSEPQQIQMTLDNYSLYGRVFKAEDGSLHILES